MEGFEIEIFPRTEAGSAASRKYRRDGLIPSIVYAHGKAGILALLPRKEFTKLAKAAKSSQVFTFKSQAEALNGQSGIVKEIQMNHINDDVLHVDFQAVSEHEEVSVRIALKFVGEAPGVKLEGGILTAAMHDVGVTCLPRLIPQEIVVDISQLNLGGSIHVTDIQIPAGVKLTEDPEATVVSVVTVHTLVEEAPAEAAPVEGEVPAEGAPAEGEAAAAPAAEGAQAAPGQKGAPAGKEAKEGKEGAKEGKEKKAKG